MNERIEKALMTVEFESGFEVRHDEEYGQVLENFTLRDAEKFAELIVRECANVIADDELAKDCDTFMMDAYAKGMRYSAEKIKKHFGVEE